jgi:hypothetical protein
MSVIKQIRKQIEKQGEGKIFFISDFINIGVYDSVRKSLQRLEYEKFIIRISKGIYYYPKTDKLLGLIYPSAEQIGKAIAKRDKARITPTGSYALFVLGLSTQVPTNFVYLTDGSSRKVKVGKQKIVFKKTSPKNLNSSYPLSNLIIQALKTIGNNNISENEIHKLRTIIKDSKEADKIKTDMANAPVWIRKIISNIIQNIKDEKLA